MSLLKKYSLMPRKKRLRIFIIRRIYRKDNEARQRMVYEELFLFQLKLQAYRALNRKRRDGIAHIIETTTIREFVRTLPFELTDGQKKVVNEILHDMRSPYA